MLNEFTITDVIGILVGLFVVFYVFFILYKSIKENSHWFKNYKENWHKNVSKVNEQYRRKSENDFREGMKIMLMFICAIPIFIAIKLILFLSGVENENILIYAISLIPAYPLSLHLI